ncbi:MAG: hypothetical protein QME61_02245, partial [Patescibacteria group bacterium]|nr:hypothetical protein [Patescibacteria group bacterium]
MEERIREEKEREEEWERAKEAYEKKLDELGISEEILEKFKKAGIRPEKLGEPTIEILQEILQKPIDQVMLRNLIKIASIKREEISQGEQVQRWKMFNTWLEMYYPDHIIPEEKFQEIPEMPELTPEEKQKGYRITLCYAFPTETGKVDLAVTCKLLWEFAVFNFRTL